MSDDELYCEISHIKSYVIQLCSCVETKYEGRSINKLQNSVILLVFQI